MLGAAILVGCGGAASPPPAPTTVVVAPTAVTLTTSEPIEPPVAMATPGPSLTSEDRLLYVRGGGFWTSKADGT
ncbi:MAG: hypothetical protein ACE5MB_08200, partial [Anaerolineae bacterium]